MGKINILPKHLAELIAAGEVVERPSSVVKELIENSVDAGADRITIEIKNGGVKYIRITDNGCGIGRDDIRSAFISHATSKIKVSEDLNRILTFGFRGEALASVASVSKVEVLTKEPNASIGTRYIIEGGTEVFCDDAGCPQGTTIIIRDLFYNTPARMKFLKRDITEGNYVSDVVEKTAVAYPNVSFKLIKDNKAVLVTNGNSDLKSAIYSVYGREFATSLLNCDYELLGVKVHGFVSKPSFARSSRSMQFLYVNGRYVRLSVASSALDNAYKNSIMVGKYPSCVLFLDMPPDFVDVNVHPAKTEVRFSDEKKVYEAVYYGVLSALTDDNSRIQVKMNNNPQNAQQIINKGTVIHQMKISKDCSEKPKVIENTDAKQIFREEVKEITIPAVSSFENKNISSPVNRKLDIAFDEFDEVSLCEKEDKTEVLKDTTTFDVAFDDESGINIDKIMAEKAVEVKNNAPKTETVTLIDETECKNDENEFRVVGEVFSTYIIVEQKKKILFIDKHAAHERIIFNSLKNRERGNISQLLLCPVTVQLGRKEYAAVIDNIDIFNQAGYCVEDFGEGCVTVRECPLDLSDSDINAVITELAGKLCSQIKSLMPEKLDWLYHSTACRSAVKAGDSLTQKEMEELVKTVLTDNEVRFCPHGRPVITEMTKYELEKQFGRIQ